jgi:hypothetical protein
MLEQKKMKILAREIEAEERISVMKQEEFQIKKSLTELTI